MRQTNTMLHLLFLILAGLCPAAALRADEINLSTSEKQIYSQNGEDGITMAIFDVIGVLSSSYVEFGTESGIQCNTRFLREQGWSGLLMDGWWENAEINLKREFITAENIVPLFQKYGVEKEFDLLSVDIDFNDFYVWKEICKVYHPRVVIIEYNATHLPNEDKVIFYDPNGGWDRSNYYGASILSLFRLGRAYGYSLVYAESVGVNLFFIRDDIIASLEEKGITFKNINDVEAIYRRPRYGWGPNGGHGPDLKLRPFASAEDILRSEQ